LIRAATIAFGIGLESAVDSLEELENFQQPARNLVQFDGLESRAVAEDVRLTFLDLTAGLPSQCGVCGRISLRCFCHKTVPMSVQVDAVGAGASAFILPLERGLEPSFGDQYV
jgi:hypothetical protein